MSSTVPHPLIAVAELAAEQGVKGLKLISVYDGKLIRIEAPAEQIVFKRASDPGSAMDRQRFDYHRVVRIEDTLFDSGPQAVLDWLRTHLTTP